MQKRTYDTVQGWKCYGKGNDIWDLDIGYKLRWVYSYPFFLYFSRFILTTRCRLRNGIRLMAWQFFYFIVTAFLPTRTVALIESRGASGVHSGFYNVSCEDVEWFSIYILVMNCYFGFYHPKRGREKFSMLHSVGVFRLCKNSARSTFHSSLLNPINCWAINMKRRIFSFFYIRIPFKPLLNLTPIGVDFCIYPDANLTFDFWQSSTG